jgi:hypothetical protein
MRARAWDGNRMRMRMKMKMGMGMGMRVKSFTGGAVVLEVRENKRSARAGRRGVCRMGMRMRMRMRRNKGIFLNNGIGRRSLGERVRTVVLLEMS